jgi:hypothetical protein
LSADKFTLIRLAAPPPSSPQINDVSLSGNDLIIRGTNGLSGGVYYLLSTTNLNLPVTNWDVVRTNIFDASGGFNLTNAIDTNSPLQFYLLQSP